MYKYKYRSRSIIEYENELRGFLWTFFFFTSPVLGEGYILIVKSK